MSNINQSEENFADLLKEFIGESTSFEGKVVKGRIVSIDNDAVLIDVGLKSEGRIELKEFGAKASKLALGGEIDIYVERIENRKGEIVLSYEKAQREAVWEDLEKASKDAQHVTGVISSRVKGGFTVDLSGAVAFLPGSQVDIRPIKDIAPLFGIEQPFQILKMDRLRGNIVVSRRAILEESRAEAKGELIKNLEEGQILQGVVKNVTDYGAFIDLGGIDGLLHVTDISWKRINHPSEVLQIGQAIDVKIVKFDAETQRISLGLKQLDKDPWIAVAENYKTDEVIKGVVTNVTDYGVFVELEDGIEGLIHVSELSWSKRVTPTKIVAPSEEVTIKILDVDPEKRRISLSLRQCIENPWTSFAAEHKADEIIEGEVKGVTEFGLFVAIGHDIEGMVHVTDLAWDKTPEEELSKYKKGDTVKAKILEIDTEKERVALGIKQLSADPFKESLGSHKSGDTVTCVVSRIMDNGIEVTIGDEGITGFIRKNDLARDRGEQRTSRFAVGERVDALVTSMDHDTRRFTLSVKARETKEEKEAMAEYGSSDSGASLGDILGSALDIQKMKASSTTDAEEKPKKPAAKKAASKKKEDA